MAQETKTVKRGFPEWKDPTALGRWLSDMAREGWLLNKASVFGHYEFIRSEPGEYTVCVREVYSKREENVFTERASETGAEMICRRSSQLFFLKRKTDGPLELPSDLGARIAHQETRLFLSVIYALLSLTNGIGFIWRLSKPVLGALWLLNSALAVVLFVVNRKALVALRTEQDVHAGKTPEP